MEFHLEFYFNAQTSSISEGVYVNLLQELPLLYF